MEDPIMGQGKAGDRLLVEAERIGRHAGAGEPFLTGKGI
jgi:hypothetical protein